MGTLGSTFMSAVRFNIYVETTPERRPSSFDVENVLVTLSDMGPDEFQVYVTGENGFYKAIIVSYPTVLPSAADVQRVLQAASGNSAENYLVTVDKLK